MSTPSIPAPVARSVIQPVPGYEPGGVSHQAPRGASTERHGFANLVEGVLGAIYGFSLTGAVLGPIGWAVAAFFALDAGLDYFTGAGIVGHFARLIGWESHKDRRSLGSQIAEAFNPPARYGYQPPQRYPAAT